MALGQDFSSEFSGFAMSVSFDQISVFILVHAGFVETKWHWDRIFSSEFSGFAMSVSFHQISVFILVHAGFVETKWHWDRIFPPSSPVLLCRYHSTKFLYSYLCDEQ
jgi:uncharacterized protein YozE (UPF0346 family)